MSEKESVLIEIQVDAQKVTEKLGEASKRVIELKTENAELQKRQKELVKQMQEQGDATGELSKEIAENAKTIALNSGEIEANSRVVKSSTALLQMQTLAQIDSNATLDEQRQLLNAAQKAYASMTDEEKEAAGGALHLKAQIKALSDSVKEQEAALGDNRRNVGNYTESIVKAADQMGGFGKGILGIINPIKNATGAMKAMAATPLIAIISVAVTILQKLAERFKGNAAAMEKLTGVFGVFSGVGNIVNKIIDKIAEGIGWIAEKALDLAEKLGILSDEMKAGQEIAKEDLAIQKEQQRVALANAESQNKIAKLKADAMEKDKYTAKQRLDMLQQAADEEEAISQRQYDLAKREYELQVKKNAQSASSQEDLKKENDLKIAMINAETALFSKQKELNSQMATLRTQLAAEGKAQADAARKAEMDAQIQYMEDMRALAEADAATAAAKAEELKKQSQALLASLVEGEDADDSDEPLSPAEQARRMFGLDDEGVAYFLKLLDEGVSFSEAKTKALADQSVRLTKSFATSFGQLGSTFTQLGDAIGSIAGESKEAQAAQKAFAFSGIIMNQAQAISEGALAIAKGVESASAIPFPGNIPAIISVVAQIGSMIGGVMSSIAQAKQIFAEADKFATGGIVGGTQYSGDNVLVRADAGEMMINRKDQTELFNYLTGKGGSLGTDYEMLAAAIASQPAPVVVYKEMQEFGDKVATYNEIARV